VSTADELKKLAELLEAGLLSREEFNEEKDHLMAQRRTTSGSSPKLLRPSQPQIGASLGAYQLLSVLGEGGMGIVYRAKHRTDAIANRQGGEVALKVMHSQYASNATYQARFEAEASMGLRLEHPGIVKVHDLVVDGSTLALAMELVTGTELSDVIGAERGPIPWVEALTLFDDLLSAVQYAHEQGVIHRDLKPENVMVCEDGSLKVLDFGIAKQEGSGKTKTGTGMGTVDYMAPEQYMDASSVDGRADVYALGLTLYEMLAGQLPWPKATTEFDVLNLKASGTFPPPTQYYPDIPPDLVRCVMDAVRHKRDERIDSPALFQERLRALLTGEEEAQRVATAESVAISATQAALKDEVEVEVEVEVEDGVPVLDDLVLSQEDQVHATEAPLPRPDTAAPKRGALIGGLLASLAAAALFLVVGLGGVIWMTMTKEVEIFREAADPGTMQIRYIRAGGLSLRAGPDTKTDRLNTIPFGTALRTERLPGSHWHRAVDLKGYVSGAYLTLRPSTERKTYVLRCEFESSDGLVSQTLTLNNGSAHYEKQSSLYGHPTVRAKGSYEVRDNTLVIRLDAGTVSAETGEGATPAETLFLQYDLSIRGFTTQELRAVKKRSKRLRGKKRWGYRNEYGVRVEQSWWYADSSDYTAKQRTKRPARVSVMAALQAQETEAPQVTELGETVWGELAIGVSRETVYAFLGNPNTSSSTGQNVRFTVFGGSTWDWDQGQDWTVGTIEVVFTDDVVSAVLLVTTEPDEDKEKRR